MQRQLIKSLVTWKDKAGRKPLLLKGARQVGKTHLLKRFGEESFENCHYINFELEKKLHDLFEQDLNPKRIINELGFATGKSININTDLVIFDEIQACPNALTSLKYFNEDLPELALCTAGSLLGVHLNIGSFPVGKVDRLNMFPMTYQEFLQALNETQLLDLLHNHDYRTAFPEAAHNRLWQWWKHYLIIGGMPEVISTYINHKEDLNLAFQEVRNKQNELVEAYFADIAKHAGKVNAMHIMRCWEQTAIQLAANHDGKATKFRFKGILPSIDRYSRLANVIDWLIAANLVIKIPITNLVQQPLKAFTKESAFKLFIFDVGMLGSLLGLEAKTIYDYRFGTFKGYLVENYVSEALQTSYNKKLYNWQANKSEIEFLNQYQQHVIPIEVKAGTITRAKSLQKFIKKYQPPLAIILSGKNIYLDKNNNLLNLPIYCAAQLPEIFAEQISD